MKKIAIILSVLFPLALFGTDFTELHAEKYETKNQQEVICVAGQDIELDGDGHIISGILHSNQVFFNEYGYEVPCRQATKVVFNENGYLVYGILSEDKSFVNSAGELVECFAGEEVEFDQNGLLNR